MIKRILKIMSISFIFAFPPLNFDQIYDDISYYLNEQRDNIIINSAQNLTIRSSFEGTIKEIYTQPGQNIDQGDTLLLFDKNELILKKELIRNRILELSQNEKENSVEIQEARLNLRIVNNQLVSSIIRAPEDGKIVRIFYHQGQYVSKGDKLFAMKNNQKNQTLAHRP